MEAKEAMQKQRERQGMRQVSLFVCSDCERCRRAEQFCREWTGHRPDVALEIVSILQRPRQVFRLGITHTPALVVDGELLAQDLAADETLAGLLRAYVSEAETGA